jgi:hypothetical protein
MTCAIIQLVIGFIFLFDVCRRIFGWTYPSDFTYKICRPLWGILDCFSLKISMKTGVIITFWETILGAVFTYRGFVDFFSK